MSIPQIPGRAQVPPLLFEITPDEWRGGPCFPQEHRSELAPDEVARMDNAARKQYYDSQVCRWCGLMSFECPFLTL